MFQTAPLLSGFFLAASLIIAIGAQNAFVLRQGLIKEHVFVVAAICSASDIILILAGVAGIGTLVNRSPALLAIAAGGGALFLLFYGLLSFRRAFRPERLIAAGSAAGTPLWPVVLTCLALTWGNPHVYLDTVIMLGGISGRYPSAGRAAFAIGASAASLVWFFALAYGARLLAPLFKRATAWRVLDIAIGIVMWAIAGRLAADLVALMSR